MECGFHMVFHFTAGCTNVVVHSRLYNWLGKPYAKEPSQAALEWFIQDAYDVTRLTCSKAAVCTFTGHKTVSAKKN